MAHAILALPPPLLAVSAALWLYWLVSLVYFAMFELPLRDSHLWYQDLTGRFMFGWALAGVVFWANAKHARGAKE
jgi:hypothetical protein